MKEGVVLWARMRGKPRVWSSPGCVFSFRVWKTQMVFIQWLWSYHIMVLSYILLICKLRVGPDDLLGVFPTVLYSEIIGKYGRRIQYKKNAVLFDIDRDTWEVPKNDIKARPVMISSQSDQVTFSVKLWTWRLQVSSQGSMYFIYICA